MTPPGWLTSRCSRRAARRPSCIEHRVRRSRLSGRSLARQQPNRTKRPSVSVQADDHDWAKKAKAILEQTGAQDIAAAVK
jgi:hypothetical protein